MKWRSNAACIELNVCAISYILNILVPVIVTVAVVVAVVVAVIVVVGIILFLFILIIKMIISNDLIHIFSHLLESEGCFSLMNYGIETYI